MSRSILPAIDLRSFEVIDLTKEMVDCLVSVGIWTARILAEPDWARPESTLFMFRHCLVFGVEFITKSRLLRSVRSSCSGGQKCGGEKFEIHFLKFFDNFIDTIQFIWD